MYFYHAHAIAFGGSIGSDPIKVEQGSCALAVTGGTSSATATKFVFQGVSFQSAQSIVSGQEKNHGYATSASVILKGLNINDTVTAEKIEANVESNYAARDDEAIVKVSGSIEGLNIRQKALKVSMSDEMQVRCTTYGSMQVAFRNRNSRPFISLVGTGVPDDMTKKFTDLKAAYQAADEQTKLSELKSTVVCSLLENITGDLPDGAVRWGPIIYVPGFGNIYLGEVIVWPWMRCLNMFRVELFDQNNKPKGSISGASVGSNGTGFPPGYAPPTNGNGW